MRILITSDLYPPVINGVATFSNNLAHGLVERGHDVAVIAPSQTGKRSVEHDGKITIYRVKSIVFPFYQNIRISLTPQREVRRIVREFKPDIIHSQMLMGIGQAATVVGRHFDIPIVTTNHAMPANLMDNLKKLSAFSRPIGYMLADFGRRYHAKSDAVTAPTRAGFRSFEKFLAKLNMPVSIISNGINLKEYRPGPVKKMIYWKYHLPKDKPIITYLGRLDAEKHVWVLLYAMREVLKKVDAHMLIVGAGVDLEHEKKIADDLGIASHVTFTGRVSEQDKKALHRVGTLFAVASPAEWQCIAALEAMASGQPVVMVNAGALSELCINKKNGARFKLDDYNGAARGMIPILTDKTLREKYSKESLILAQKNDIQTTISQFVALYEETIAKKTAEIAARPVGWRDRLRESDFAEFMRLGVENDDTEGADADESCPVSKKR